MLSLGRMNEPTQASREVRAANETREAKPTSLFTAAEIPRCLFIPIGSEFLPKGFERLDPTRNLRVLEELDQVTTTGRLVRIADR